MITPVILVESEQITNAQRLITDTMELVCPLDCHSPIIFCHSKFHRAIKKVVEQLNIDATILCAPSERGSAIALTCAAQMSLLQQDKATLAIFHHWQPIADFDAFEHSLCLGAQLTDENYLVTLDNPVNCQFFAQPSQINSWMIDAAQLIDIMNIHFPTTFDNCRKALQSEPLSANSKTLRLASQYFNACPSLIVDNAIFPLVAQRVDIPLTTRWNTFLTDNGLSHQLSSLFNTNKRQSDQGK
jgi:mannose-1-phosphate guanylyltransferase